MQGREPDEDDNARSRDHPPSDGLPRSASEPKRYWQTRGRGITAGFNLQSEPSRSDPKQASSRLDPLHGGRLSGSPWRPKGEVIVRSAVCAVKRSEAPHK